MEHSARQEEAERLKVLEHRKKRSYVEWYGMNIFEMSELVQTSNLDYHMKDLIE